MYKPAPPRPKKTNIVRTRTGCRNCRARRKKCDETRPACNACTRLGKHCDGYVTNLEFRNVSFRQTKSQRHSSETDRTPSLLPQDINSGSSPRWRLEEMKECTLPGTNDYDWLIPNAPIIPSRGVQALQPAARRSVSNHVPCSATLEFNMSIKPSRELFYMSVWGNQCAPALHPIFPKIARLQNLPPVVTDTMMALAARQLSRMLPRKRVFSSLDIFGSPFRPDIEQQNISGELFGSAMRNVAQWTRADLERNPTTVTAVLVLFCYLESLMSNFRGFYLHSAAVETLMDVRGGHKIQPGGYEADLFAAWIQSKMHNWWRRFHFGTATFQLNHPPLITKPMMSYLSGMADSTRVLILGILCESYRLNAAAFMCYYNDTVSPEPAPVSDVEAQITISQLPSSHASMTRQGQEEQLNYQRKALGNWYARLSAFELPIDPYSTTHDATYYDPAGLRIQPLRFESHDAAMNFAYYITARVMQNTAYFGASKSSHDQSNTGGARCTAEPWIILLLRVAAGINWDSCTRLNTYTIGLSSLLLACVLRSNDLAIGIWVHDWLNQRYQEGHLEEGSFPIFQILQVLRIVNRERGCGRHVYAVCQPVDDGGGRGKFDSYNSQKLVSLLVYGSCMDPNYLYSRHIISSHTPTFHEGGEVREGSESISNSPTRYD